MPPCLRRKQTSSVANSQQSQSRSSASHLRDTKSVTNKDSKENASSKVRNTRSAILSRNTMAEKEVGISTEAVKPVTKKEDQTIVKRKNLRKGTGQEVPAKIKNVAPRNVSNTRKNQTKSITKKISKKVNKNDSILRQVSLKESFLNQSKIKRLRPRRNIKNYQDDDSLVNKHLSPKKRSSIVLLKELKTMPIYKYVSPETSVKNASEIYEFKFDSNDSKERLPKKRKKKRTVAKKTVTRKKKNIPETRNTQKGEVKEKLTNVESEVIHEKDEPLKEQICVKPLIKNPVKDDSDKCVKNNVALNKELTNTNAEKTTSNEIMRPTIKSIECLPNRNITLMDNSQISKSDEFKPFRPTNIFNNKFLVQHKNMLNNSLFDKSLSPIIKSSENFDLNSPWRAPPSLFTFSQVKNVFQSTPQNNKYEIYGNRLSRAINNESKSCENITTAKDSLLKNDENVSMEGYVNTNNIKRKHPLISRKFGTEITNVDHSVQSPLGDEINERVISDVENIQPSVPSINVINTSNTFKSNDTEDKENSVLNYQSPKKVLKKTRKKKTISPQKIRSAENYEQKENLDPQPGPSGLQKNVPFSEQRILKQSNLNNFLNVMEKPQQIAIETPHGIFNDAPSTPISRKSIRKHNKLNMDLKNAFGFNDDNFNQDISFTEHDNENAKDIEKRDVKPFQKKTIKDIQNHFLPKQSRKIVRNKENVENKETELRKSPAKVKQNHIPIDTTNFSDTFDVLSELDETSTQNKSDVPLFMDLEPSHFTQPPKHSYKRKRNVKFSFSDESDEGEDENLEKHEVKRKRANNMKEKDNKNVIKWIEDINRTFAEVDEHELVVE
ncbi:uncharacterized protein LOC128880380 [Hylaeus volcanicus]|uniref:uncharacterized protein LOC128880380 n=1 Tax=Hylaeus volcanicus TaxID=313075 RepID=UPI0023B77E1B|nr:uncharacterized protein LOC128880380 [Hylaeus volcanicus]